jgi:hypothetical protein
MQSIYKEIPLTLAAVNLVTNIALNLTNLILQKFMDTITF